MQQAITRTITSISVRTHHHHHGDINTPPSTTIRPLARGAKYHLISPMKPYQPKAILTTPGRINNIIYVINITSSIPLQSLQVTFQ